MKRCISYPDYQSDSHPNKTCVENIRCECGRWLIPIGIGGDFKPYWTCPKERELVQEYPLG